MIPPLLFGGLSRGFRPVPLLRLTAARCHLRLYAVRVSLALFRPPDAPVFKGSTPKYKPVGYISEFFSISFLLFCI